VIDNASLEREWIMKLRNERFPKRDPGIIEKAIYTLPLLEEFSAEKLLLLMVFSFFRDRLAF